MRAPAMVGRHGKLAVRRGGMVMPVYSYDPPDRFVAGTVGQPGERTFYLQARSGAMTTSVALEKGQVEQLAERLDELLDEVGRRTGADVAGDQSGESSPSGDRGPWVPT